MVAIKGIEIPKSCGECNLTACKGYDEPWNYCCAITLTDIDLNDTEKPSDCPLVEIEERKVGKWIKTGGSFRCSECMVMPEFKDIRTLKYCPSCGAEMKGESNNDKSNIQA